MLWLAILAVLLLPHHASAVSGDWFIPAEAFQATATPCERTTAGTASLWACDEDESITTPIWFPRIIAGLCSNDLVTSCQATGDCSSGYCTAKFQVSVRARGTAANGNACLQASFEVVPDGADWTTVDGGDTTSTPTGETAIAATAGNQITVTLADLEAWNITAAALCTPATCKAHQGRVTISRVHCVSETTGSVHIQGVNLSWSLP